VPILARFPLNGTNGVNWMINNYVDLDPEGGVRDYLGKTGSLARTYDGHQGMDIDIPSFREMDSGAARVFAVTDGTVVGVVASSPNDRETTGCTTTTPPRTMNQVVVDTGSGYTISYYHFRNNSIPAFTPRVSQVKVGDFLGVAGSSGCSTWAHLHLEVNDSGGAIQDTMVKGMWVNDAPVYDPPQGIMDVMLRSGASPTVAQVIDPSPNPASMATFATLGIGFTGTLRGGDVVDFSIKNPSNSVFATRRYTDTFDARTRHIFAPMPAVVLSGSKGTWKVEVKLNNVAQPARTVTFTM
jgi:murein DD-endopeptidase MepM/ murein hydrolase activator NlpD